MDAAGRLVWLRPRSREVRRPPAAGHPGRSSSERSTGRGRAPDSGRSHPHLGAAGQRLDRYASRPFSGSPRSSARAAWTVTDAAGDGGDGVWLARSTHPDDGGCAMSTAGGAVAAPIPVGGPERRRAARRPPPTAAWLAVVDPMAAATVHVVDAAGGGSACSIALDPVHAGRRTLLTAAPGERIHLADGTGRSRRRRWRRRCLPGAEPVDGDVEDHQELTCRASVGRPRWSAGPGWSWPARGPGRDHPRPG